MCRQTYRAHYCFQLVCTRYSTTVSRHSLHYNACLYNIWVKTEAIDLELPRLLEPWLTRWNPAPQVMALDSVSALSVPDN